MRSKKMHEKGNRGSTYRQLQCIINEGTKHNLVEEEKRRCSRHGNRWLKVRVTISREK